MAVSALQINDPVIICRERVKREGVFGSIYRAWDWLTEESYQQPNYGDPLFLVVSPEKNSKGERRSSKEVANLIVGVVNNHSPDYLARTETRSSGCVYIFFEPVAKKDRVNQIFAENVRRVLKSETKTGKEQLWCRHA